jgi:hypothetical protein
MRGGAVPPPQPIHSDARLVLLLQLLCSGAVRKQRRQQQQQQQLGAGKEAGTSPAAQQQALSPQHIHQLRICHVHPQERALAPAGAAGCNALLLTGWSTPPPFCRPAPAVTLSRPKRVSTGRRGAMAATSRLFTGPVLSAISARLETVIRCVGCGCGRRWGRQGPEAHSLPRSLASACVCRSPSVRQRTPRCRAPPRPVAPMWPASLIALHVIFSCLVDARGAAGGFWSAGECRGHARCNWLCRTVSSTVRLPRAHACPLAARACCGQAGRVLASVTNALHWCTVCTALVCTCVDGCLFASTPNQGFRPPASQANSVPLCADRPSPRATMPVCALLGTPCPRTWTP